MDILFRRGRATVAEVMGDLPDPPTYSAVRSVLRILVVKGLVSYREDGPRYVYVPAVSPNSARDEALQHVVRTFFEGSTEQAVTALLRLSDTRLSDGALARLAELVRRERNTGR
jgi:predicted transcriptional regulator